MRISVTSYQFSEPMGNPIDETVSQPLRFGRANATTIGGIAQLCVLEQKMEVCVCVSTVTHVRVCMCEHMCVARRTLLGFIPQKPSC